VRGGVFRGFILKRGDRLGVERIVEAGKSSRVNFSRVRDSSALKPTASAALASKLVPLTATATTVAALPRRNPRRESFVTHSRSSMCLMSGVPPTAFVDTS
jgi:hypothetical protein